MKRSGIAVLTVALLLLAGATAQATVEWQTTPILGYGTYYVGDVGVITGPQPMNGLDPYYHWVGGPEALGPFIPESPTIGNPSVTVFSQQYLDTFAAASGAKLAAIIASDPSEYYGVLSPKLELNSGSGVYVDTGHTYQVTQQFISPSSVVIDGSFVFFADLRYMGFVMNQFSADGGGDIGRSELNGRTGHMDLRGELGGRGSVWRLCRL